MRARTRGICVGAAQYSVTVRPAGMADSLEAGSSSEEDGGGGGGGARDTAVHASRLGAVGAQEGMAAGEEAAVAELPAGGGIVGC